MTPQRTITGADWRDMFRRSRAQGEAEGNLLLIQIRAALAARERRKRATTIGNLSSPPDSLAGAGRAGDRLGITHNTQRSGGDEAISSSGSHPTRKATERSVAACENQ